MKRTKLSNLLLCIVLLPLLLAWGCATSPEVGAYTAISASNVAVKNTLQAWGDYCLTVRGTTNEVTQATHARVKAAYETYLQAALGAVDAAITIKAGGSGDWSLAQAQLRKAVSGFIIAVETAKRPPPIRTE